MLKSMNKNINKEKYELTDCFVQDLHLREFKKTGTFYADGVKKDESGNQFKTMF